MPKKILVIDDEMDFADTLKQCLEMFEYEVKTASNGKEGLDILNEEMPDLIVLDLMMPVMDGFEFYRIIKTDPKWHSIPVLIVTGRSDMEDTIEAVDVDEFMTKPLVLEDFICRVKPLVEGKSSDDG